MEMMKEARAQVTYQVEYKDDCNRKHICFVPKAMVSYYKHRFDVTDVFETDMILPTVDNDENF